MARAAPSNFETFHLDDEDQPGSVLYKLFGGPNSSADQLRRSASPYSLLDTINPTELPPCLLVHGTSDETVPYEQSARLTDKINQVGGRAWLRPVEGGHHNMTGNPFLSWTNDPWELLGDEAATFFQDHLGLAR